jgi:hypothetical protein
MLLRSLLPEHHLDSDSKSIVNLRMALIGTMTALLLGLQGIPYGSGPFSQEDMQTNTRRGGRGVYFKDPNGHLLEIMTRT